jgi:CheY-like chemotaxis protein
MPQSDLLKGLPVLVVDDNATNRRVLTEMLKSWRMKPTTAPDGPRALAALDRAAKENRAFPVMILDAHMPKMDGFDLARQVRQSSRDSKAKMIMLTSAGSDDQERSQKMKVNACLTKPVRQSQLLETLVAVVGPQRKDTPQAIVRVANGAGRHLRILVAEDNPVNRQLMVQLLKRKGHSVDVVENGKMALAAMGRESFDLVMMDVQMPVMGGIETTAAIRDRERSVGGHVPIIATTAHAMAGDRDRFLQSGMDAYLAKPIQAQELYDVIEKLTGTTGTVDEAALLDGVGGDAPLLVSLIDVFLSDYPRLFERLRRAISAQRVDGFRQAAHALKGSIGNFGQTRAYHAACELDLKAKSGSLRGADKAFAQLKSEMVPFKKSLKEIRDRTLQQQS